MDKMNNQKLGTPYQMKAQQYNPPRATDGCVFCGGDRTTDTASHLIALDHATENSQVCQYCLDSLKDRTPMVWLRWIRRNDPAHWQKVVEHHRLGSGNLSNVISRIRIE